MKNRFDIRSIVFGAVLSAVILLALGATSSRNPSWEYETYRGYNRTTQASDAINRIGSEGWELVTSYDKDGIVTLLFKRRL